MNRQRSMPDSTRSRRTSKLQPMSPLGGLIAIMVVIAICGCTSASKTASLPGAAMFGVVDPAAPPIPLAKRDAIRESLTMAEVFSILGPAHRRTVLESGSSFVDDAVGCKDGCWVWVFAGKVELAVPVVLEASMHPPRLLWLTRSHDVTLR